MSMKDLFRKPRTIQDHRWSEAHQEEVKVRARRNKRNLPHAWDDIFLEEGTIFWAVTSEFTMTASFFRYRSFSIIPFKNQHTKITLANDVIDLGNEGRLNAFRAQAERDPELIRQGMQSLEQLDEKFNGFM